ncbi:MAG: PilZ domain-containing protein [Chloroflexota bacterium]
MDEKRKLARKYLIVYSRVFERSLGKMLGYLSDLSPMGAMVISEQPQAIDVVLPLRFDLPGTGLFSTNKLDVSARVVRCDLDIDPSFYNIGFEFQDLKPEQLPIVERMMETYEFRRNLAQYPQTPAALRDDQA